MTLIGHPDIFKIIYLLFFLALVNLFVVSLSEIYASITFFHFIARDNQDLPKYTFEILYK